jgi:hypothetical protein
MAKGRKTLVGIQEVGVMGWPRAERPLLEYKRWG